MAANQFDFHATPRVIVPIDQSEEFGVSSFAVPTQSPAGSRPIKQTSATAPAKMSYSPLTGLWPANLSSMVGEGIGLTNLDLTGFPDNKSQSIITVTTPHIYVKYPSAFGAGACVVELYIAAYQSVPIALRRGLTVGQTNWLRLTNKKRVVVPGAGGANYATVAPVTFQYDEVRQNSPVQPIDVAYFDSASFVGTLSICWDFIFTSTLGVDTAFELDMGLNIDPAHLSTDPVASFGPDGVTFALAPQRRRAFFL
jgi:hypothetical protein